MFYNETEETLLIHDLCVYCSAMLQENVNYANKQSMNGNMSSIPQRALHCRTDMVNTLLKLVLMENFDLLQDRIGQLGIKPKHDSYFR